MTKTINNALATLVLTLSVCSVASAQFSRALRETSEMILKGTSRVARESAEAAARRALRESAEASVRVLPDIGTVGLSKLLPDLSAAVTQKGATLIAPTVRRMAVEGTGAATTLAKPRVSGTKLLDLLPGGADKWWAGLSKYSDDAAGWLWKHKGSVAVGTAATAVLMKPEAFAESAEHVASTAITTAGSDIVRPVIEQSGQQVVAPIVEKMTNSWAFPVLGGCSLLSVMAIGGYAATWYYRRWSKRCRPNGVVDNA